MLQIADLRGHEGATHPETPKHAILSPTTRISSQKHPRISLEAPEAVPGASATEDTLAIRHDTEGVWVRPRSPNFFGRFRGVRRVGFIDGL